MNTNPPNVTSTAGLERLPILINKQKRFGTGMILTPTGKKLVVKLSDWLIDGVQLHDFVEVKKSAVTGELIVTDYFINFETSAAIHNSYQTHIDDMIVDERGVPYE